MKKVDLSFGGLATSVNPFSSAKELSCAILDNCVLRNSNLIEPRRGYTKSAANPGSNISRVFPWQSRLFTFALDNKLRDFSDGTGWSSTYSQAASDNWPAQTTFSAPDASNPIRSVIAGKSFIFTTSAGVKVIDGVGNGVLDAGLPAPSITATFGVVGRGPQLKNGGAAWLLNGYSVAYRAVLCRFDANNTLIQSSPSAPATVTNTGTTAFASVQLFAPVNLNGSTFFQIYRTVQSNNPNGPGDEMFLVYESSGIPFTTLASTIQIIDGLSDNGGTGSVLLGVPLYTNPISGSGTGAANSMPPLARDVCAYNGVALYANTTERNSLQLQLIGTTGLVPGTSTITIGGVTYRADSSTSATSSPPTFTLQNALGSASLNIDATAQALVNVVNEYNFLNGGNVEAFYLSTPDTMPGQMAFAETGIGGSAFTITVGQNGQVCWAPDIPTTGTTLTSKNNRQPARLWWSAINQPWAVPAGNWVIVGAADQDILRVVVVRNTVFVFKKDGLFTLTGTAAPFTIQPFDPGLVLLAPESVCVVDNRVFCLTNRGYVYVTESGVSPSMSAPIERDINFYEFNNGVYAQITFGVGYENEGWAFLALPVASDIIGVTQQYLFNVGNPSWSRFTLPSAQHGCFDPARQAIVWAVGDSLWEERKTLADADIQDPPPTGLSVASTVNSNTVTVSGGNLQAGDLITQDSITFARVVSWSHPTATLDAAYSFSAAGITVLRGFLCHIRFLPWSGGDPTTLKRLWECFLAFRNVSFPLATYGFNSETTPSYSSTALAGPEAAGTGAVESAQFVARANLPQAVSRCAMLGIDIQIQQAEAFWQLEAMSIGFDADAEEPVR